MLAHGYCLQWNPWLIALHVTSDWMIWVAYMTIPIVLFVLHGAAIGKIKHTRELWMFGLFIGLCGMTHFLEILSVWASVYWFTGFAKLATGIVSLYTAFYITTDIGLVMDSFRQLDVAVRGNVPKEPHA